MSKHLSSEWFPRAERLANLEQPFRAKNIAICLASAYRQGWAASREEEVQNAAVYASVLLRTIAAEAKRAGSWHVPADLQERVRAFVKEAEGGKR
ncbi:MAG: hypothetical protein E6Q97_37870 [Desulfurellales bacterium]|nr:MAG: hypothetical protein E6Q97_37870 [Desulfurellales bacterium]